jgi:hypothetical protein
MPKSEKPTHEEKCEFKTCRKCKIAEVVCNCPSPEARVDWENIQQLREVYDMGAHFDKINELVDAFNKLSAAFEKGREAR